MGRGGEAAPPGAGAVASAEDAGGGSCPHALVGGTRSGERLPRLRGTPTPPVRAWTSTVAVTALDDNGGVAGTPRVKRRPRGRSIGLGRTTVNAHSRLLFLGHPLFPACIGQSAAGIPSRPLSGAFSFTTSFPWPLRVSFSLPTLAVAPAPASKPFDLLVAVAVHFSRPRRRRPSLCRRGPPGAPADGQPPPRAAPPPP